MAKPDIKVNSTRFQKSSLRKLIRDDRLSPSSKLLATLLLSWIEEIHPRPLVESIIREQYCSADKIRLPKEVTDLGTAIEDRAADKLKEEWKILKEENNADADKYPSST